MQWGSRALTSNLYTNDYITGYRDLNQSTGLDFEMCSETDLTTVLALSDAQRLLAKNPNGTQSSPNSILNFTNAKYLYDNLNNVSNLATYFKLNSTQATALAKYYNSTIKSLSFSSNSPTLSYYRARYSRDGLLKVMDFLSQYVFDNMTMKAFYQLYSDRKGTYACRDYFWKPFADQICSDNILTLDKYDGIVLWVSAYYFYSMPYPGQVNPIPMMMARLGVASKDYNLTFNNIVQSGMFGTTLAEIQNDFMTYFGCFAPGPCDRKFLSQLQFYQSGATNINNPKYPNLKVQFASNSIR